MLNRTAIAVFVVGNRLLSQRETDSVSDERRIDSGSIVGHRPRWRRTVPLTLILVADDEPLQTALRASLPPPHQVQAVAWTELFDGTRLSDVGQALVGGDRMADAVLVRWDVEHAAQLNNVGYYLRRSAQTPLWAVCLGAPTEAVAALSAGADDVLTLAALGVAHLRADRIPSDELRHATAALHLARRAEASLYAPDAWHRAETEWSRALAPGSSLVVRWPAPPQSTSR